MMQKKRMALMFLVIVLIAPAFSATSAASAQEASPNLTMDAQPAYDGYFKHGEWLPVWVTLENRGHDLNAELQVRVPSSMGGGTTFVAPAPLPGGAHKRIAVYVLPNSYSEELKVLLVSGTEVLLSQKIKVKPQPNINYLIGLISDQRGALSMLQGVALPGNRFKVLVDLALNEIPPRSEALRSFDCLIFNNIDTANLSLEAAAALESWVKQGGRLIIGGGIGAQRTAAGLPHSLVPVIPGGLRDLESLSQMEGSLGVPSLAEFAATEPIHVPGPFVVATGEITSGHTLAVVDDLPLVQESKLGEGYIDFIALDLASSPFNAWSGTTAFWETLLTPSATYPNWLPPDMSPTQVQAGQIIYALTNLPALDLPSVRNLAILLTIYIILVGPTNYWFLRWQKRLHFAWVTIPLITVLFSAGAFGVAYLQRGSNLILNKVAVVRALPGDSKARVTTYLGLFSPAQQSYEVEVHGNGLLSPLNQDYDPWGQTVSSVNETAFVQGNPGLVRGLSVNQWSMQIFMTEDTWPDFGIIESDLILNGEGLSGMLRNHSPHTFKDVNLVMGYHFERLGEIAPGAEVSVALKQTEDFAAIVPSNPLGYRLYPGDYNPSGFSGPNRQEELKRTMVDSLFQSAGGGGGGGMSAMLSSSLPPRPTTSPAGMPQGAYLIAWLDEAPPQVRVKGQELIQQTTTMAYIPLSYRLPEMGAFTIPPGFIRGTLLEISPTGGVCGMDNTSIWLQDGEALMELRLPLESDATKSVRIETLKILLRSDGGLVTLPQVGLYNWTKNSWTTLEDPVIGTNTIKDAAALIGQDGRILVRFVAEGNINGGCLYLDMGVEGSR